MDMFKMLGELKNMKSKVKEMEEKMKSFTAAGESGEVKVTLNGKFELLEIVLPKDLTKYNSEALSNKIMAAYEDGMRKVKAYIEKEFGFIKNTLGLGNIF